ncbi:MAG: UDP-N-acetylmuramate--L-alanine ligase, partial [Lachnospiraceae bacterium]|nr:UDP-N-acetylmuramate--L-alanine ligase [Lachnospiraceae bacterium]
TTSMVTDILMAADLDPTISVGGMLKEIGGNIRIGASEYFVTEACEYTNSFLSFYPTVDIILNIEEDHLDFFKDINDIRASFRKFAQLLPKDGLLIINAGIDNYKELTDGLECKVVTVSYPVSTDASESVITNADGAGADYMAGDVSYDDLGCASFTIVRKGEPEGTDKNKSMTGNDADRITLHVPGAHNIGNALAAIALADHLGIDHAVTARGLAEFRGTDRRFQYKGKLRLPSDGATAEGSVTVVDDYAHHPTEIRATLNAARKCTKGRIVCVFQPHTYTRTKAFFDDFADALSLADMTVLAEIYAAREKDTLGMSSALLCDELKKKGKESYYFSTFDEIEEFLRKNCLQGDLLITMGAGDVVNIGEDLLKE